jgi:hypothetical protein
LSATSPRHGLVNAFKVFCHVTTLLTILQAALAGLFISGEDIDAKDQHELMANIIFVSVAVQLVLGFLVRGWSQFRLMYWVGALFVLVIAQTGLGYASRDETLPEAVHVPLGVFIFGLALVISTLAVLEDRIRGSQAPQA